MKYRPDIDGLRAVAVLPVVLYHAGLPGPSGGFLGVDVFFVISGYLITRIIADEIVRGEYSLLSFYERRARRILPALTVVVVATYLAGWFLLLPGEMEKLGGSALATALFLSNVYFAVELDYFARAAEFSPLLHTWSLAVEEQFYLFFPPLLAFIAVRWGACAGLAAVVVLSVLSLLAAILVLPTHPDMVFYLIVFRAWELGAGAVLALAALNAPRSRHAREVMAAVALLSILVPVFAYDSATPFPGLAAVPPVFGATVLIWVGAKGGGSLVSSVLAWRGMVWVGLISYSLYLWHWPILSLLRISLERVALPVPVAVGAVAASFLAAWLSYRFVERPFRVRPPKGFGRGPIFSASILSIAAVGTVSAIMVITEGLPGRLPANVVALSSAADDSYPRQQECLRTRPADDACPIGAPAAPGAPVDFLFWGDSHASAMAAGLERAAKDAGRSGLLAARPACPPLRDIQRDSDSARCTAYTADIWYWLNEHPDVPMVILAARWTLSVEGTRYHFESGDGVRLEWIGPAETRPGATDNATLVEVGLRETAKALVAGGREVILIGPVPEIGRNVPAATARAALMGHDDQTGLARAAFDARAGRTEDILMRVASEFETARYLPLSDLFCDETVCRTEDADGVPLYRDDDHITRTTAERLLAPRFSEIWR